MKNQLKRSRAESAKNAGFTLVELLVVVIIIGIIASIATLGYSGARRYSAVSACKIEWATANSALIAYRSDYPTDPITITATNSTLYDSAAGFLIVKGYMSALIASSSLYKIRWSPTDGYNSMIVEKAGTPPIPIDTGDSSACTKI